MFVNQTLTARTVGLVGGVLAGLALALTGPLFTYLPNYIFIYHHYLFIIIIYVLPLPSLVPFIIFFVLNVFVTTMLSCTLPQQAQVHSHRQAPSLGGGWVRTFFLFVIFLIL